MVDSQFRHPRLVALLTIASLVVAMVAVMGPRGGGITGVGDAAADGTPADATTTTTTSTDPNYNDGVVLTIPAGELVSVIDGSTPDPTALATVVAPPATASAGTAAPTSSAPTQSAAAPPATAPTTATSTPERPDESAAGTETDGSDGDVPDVSPSIDNSVASDVTEPSIVPAAVSDVVTISLQQLPVVEGSANASSTGQDRILGQLGTRDSNSTPWMLLIGANFLVAGGALAALRLRR